MLKPRFELVVTSLIVLTLGVAVGCGDGTVHRERIPKLPAAGSRGGLNGGVTGQGAKLPAGSPGSTSAATQITNYKSQIEAYPPLTSLKATADGTYTLDTVTTIFNYMPTSGFVSLLTPSQVTINGDSVTLSTSGTPISTGMLTNHVDTGRSIMVPVTISAVAEQNLFDAKIDTLSKKFVAQVAQSKTTLQAADAFSADASTTKDTLVLNDLVNAGSNAVDGNNNKVGVNVNKIDDTHIVVEINADDLVITQANAVKSNAKDGSVSRTFVFIYKFTATPVAPAEPGHQTTPKSSTGAVAPMPAAPAAPAATPDEGASAL